MAFETCGDVELSILMSCDRVCVERAALVGTLVPETSALRLMKRYTGQAGFFRFVDDFGAGEHRFGLHDFTDSYPPSVWPKLETRMRTYGIRAILVYFRVRVSPALDKLIQSLDAKSIVAHRIVR